MWHTSRLSYVTLALPVRHRTSILRDDFDKFAGYPPADAQVHDFLTSSAADQQTSFVHCVAFLISLFKQFLSLLRQPGSDWAVLEYSELALGLHNFMAEGGTWTNHGANRRNFYRGVIDEARKVRVCLFYSTRFPGKSSLNYSAYPGNHETNDV